jgi:hypothetical protein
MLCGALTLRLLLPRGIIEPPSFVFGRLWERPRQIQQLIAIESSTLITAS